MGRLTTVESGSMILVYMYFNQNSIVFHVWNKLLYMNIKISLNKRLGKNEHDRETKKVSYDKNKDDFTLRRSSLQWFDFEKKCTKINVEWLSHLDFAYDQVLFWENSRQNKKKWQMI